MKKNLFLISSIAIIAYLYFFLDKPKNKFLFEFEKLNRITIIRNEETIKLEKKENTWQVIQPLYAKANETFIKNIENTLNSLEPTSTIDEVDPKQGIYGLNPPEMVFLAEGEFGKEVLSFGKYVDYALARYVQKENDPNIYMIKEELYTLLNSKLSTLVSNYPIKFKTENLQSIAVIPANSIAYVIKKNSDNWSLESSFAKFDVDQKIFTNSINKLSNLETLDFVESQNLESYGLTQPVLTIRLLLNQGKNSEVIDLIFGKSTGPYYYMKQINSLTIFKIYLGAISDWIKEIDFFRKRNLFNSPKLADIKALSVMDIIAFVASDEKLELEIEGKKLEIGQKVPGMDEQESPRFVKINQEYAAILSAKDIELLKSYHVQ